MLCDRFGAVQGFGHDIRPVTPERRRGPGEHVGFLTFHVDLQDREGLEVEVIEPDHLDRAGIIGLDCDLAEIARVADDEAPGSCRGAQRQTADLDRSRRAVPPYVALEDLRHLGVRFEGGTRRPASAQ